jgi:hypothetical protein
MYTCIYIYKYIHMFEWKVCRSIKKVLKTGEKGKGECLYVYIPFMTSEVITEAPPVSQWHPK